MNAAASRMSSSSLGVLGCIEKRARALQFPLEVRIFHGGSEHQIDRTSEETGQFCLKSEIVAQPRPEFLLGLKVHEKIQVAAAWIKGLRDGRAKQLQPFYTVTPAEICECASLAFDKGIHSRLSWAL